MKTLALLAFVSLLFAARADLPFEKPAEPLPQTTAPVREVIEVSTATQAFSALLHFGGVSPAGVTFALLVISTVAKGLRNYAVKDPTGNFAKVVGHLSLNPIQQPQPPDATAPPAGADRPYLTK